MDSDAAAASEFPRRPVSFALSVAAVPFSGAWHFPGKLLIICEPPPSAIRALTLCAAVSCLNEDEGSDHKSFPSDRKSTRLNSSHGYISYAVFCLKKKNTQLIPRLVS